MMGCSPGDTECNADEYPLHQVILSPFMILETEVTEGQYMAVIGANPSNPKRGANYPVDTVSWNDADAFCKAIGGQLPTEAQWEFAARAGTVTRFPCGNDQACLATTAWCGSSTDKKQPVAQKIPNAFGLFDAVGNVSEWAFDEYQAQYYSSGDKNDPVGPDGDAYKVVRGANITYSTTGCRLSNRSKSFRTLKDELRGMRCAK
jgi:formylglycine-generating enzyme required for sulfatase activity